MIATEASCIKTFLKEYRIKTYGSECSDLILNCVYLSTLFYLCIQPCVSFV